MVGIGVFVDVGTGVGIVIVAGKRVRVGVNARVGVEVIIEVAEGVGVLGTSDGLLVAEMVGLTKGGKVAVVVGFDVRPEQPKPKKRTPRMISDILLFIKNQWNHPIVSLNQRCGG